MTGKRIGYIRVSTIAQNPDRQLEGIALDKKFIDYNTGKNRERPQFKIMMEWAREDDIILVHSMDRLARTVKDLREIVDFLINKGVKVHFIKENLKFEGKDDAMSNLLLNIMGAYAEFEHTFILERIKEGIEIAKKAGKYRGRTSLKLSPQRMEDLKTAMLTRKSKSKIAAEFGISRFTLYRYLSKIQNSENVEAV